MAAAEIRGVGAQGRWKEPVEQFRPDVDIASVTRILKDKRAGVSHFRHLTVEREVRICVRYLSDGDYRLTKIAQEIKTRPANLRQMFAAYGIDIRNRTLVAA